jgi:formylglycine-generating enzyme required for sulfatase activity
VCVLVILLTGIVVIIRNRTGKEMARVVVPGGDSVETKTVADIQPGKNQPVWYTNSLGMKFAWIPPGTFIMGSPPNEEGREAIEAQHEVTLTKGFYLGVYEVTQVQWQRVMGSNPSHFSPTGGGKEIVKGLDTTDFPVEQVSWEDVVVFSKKLSELPDEQRSGRMFRLPTEAEWEYSCRGRFSSYQTYAFGNSLTSTQANFDLKLVRTSKIGTYQPNSFGLFDMHGNEWEWCADWYDVNYYRNSPRQDPPGPPGGSHRVLRGGGWLSDGRICRSAFRNKVEPGHRGYDVGFRLALVPPSGN